MLSLSHYSVYGAVDVYASLDGGEFVNLVKNLERGDSTGYVPVDSGNYVIEIRESGNGVCIWFAA